jgi:hypothetical protein
MLNRLAIESSSVLGDEKSRPHSRSESRLGYRPRPCRSLAGDHTTRCDRSRRPKRVFKTQFSKLLEIFRIFTLVDSEGLSITPDYLQHGNFDFAKPARHDECFLFMRPSCRRASTAFCVGARRSSPNVSAARAQLCDHAPGNLRALMNIADGLFAAAERDARQIDEEQIFGIFETFTVSPAAKTRAAAAGRGR